MESNNQFDALQKFASEAGVEQPVTSTINHLPKPSSRKDRPLPSLIGLDEFMETELPEPKELVAGLIHQGTKACLGGSSKSGKTWSLLDLGLSVAAGVPWMGRPTAQGRVLFANFEVDAKHIQKRIDEIIKAKGICRPTGFSIWNLRGHSGSMRHVVPRMLEMIKGQRFDLIILDPIYKLNGGRDENAAGDTTELLNELEQLVVESGAAVVYATHFSKGNQSQKEAMDRISGSGVFARDPDSILTITPHKEEDAFVIESTLRNFAPAVPFVVRWKHPLMEPEQDLNPRALKRPGAGSRIIRPTMEQFMKLFPENWINSPRNSVLISQELEKEFQQRGWEQKAICELRDEAVKNGDLEILTGASNRKFTGRPSVIEALEKEIQREKSSGNRQRISLASSSARRQSGGR